MRNMLALIGLFVVVVAGVGLWRGWLKFHIDDSYNIVIQLDTRKATIDVKDGTQKVVQELNKNQNPNDNKSNDFVGPLLPAAETRTPADLLTVPR